MDNKFTQFHTAAQWQNLDQDPGVKTCPVLFPMKSQLPGNSVAVNIWRLKYKRLYLKKVYAPGHVVNLGPWLLAIVSGE